MPALPWLKFLARSRGILRDLANTQDPARFLENLGKIFLGFLQDPAWFVSHGILEILVVGFPIFFTKIPRENFPKNLAISWQDLAGLSSRSRGICSPCNLGNSCRGIPYVLAKIPRENFPKNLAISWQDLAGFFPRSRVIRFPCDPKNYCHRTCWIFSEILRDPAWKLEYD